jgi:WD40 repeat protein
VAVDTQTSVWSIAGVEAIDSWSVSPATKRLAYSERGAGLVGDDKGISIIDCTTGKRLIHWIPTAVARLLGVEFFHASEIALTPNDGRLLLCQFSTAYGPNAFMMDATNEKQVSTLPLDATPREVSFSPDGRYLSVVADDEVLCVRDLQEKREVFFRGKRIMKEPEFQSATIDAPFFSHLRCDGHTLIYTEDNSWATGEVFVHDLASKKTKTFDARNGHIELDVDFRLKRIVLTGTKAGLTLMDFDGTVLADLKNATLQRNCAVALSPSGQRVAVGSWDNALYVYEFVESPPAGTER